MIKSLKKIYKKIFKRDISPPKGITIQDFKKLKSMKRFQTNEVEFYGMPFKFSDSVGFLHSIDEIVKDEIYQFESDKESPLIIDCGSSFGLSIYFFKKLNPKSRIIGFEADSEIFKLLKMNVSNFPNNDNIIIHNKAVWTKNERLSFYREGSLAGSLNTDFGNKSEVIEIQAIDLKDYLNQSVDFLKLDIEGAENQIIFHIKDLLKNVKNLFLEYHGIIGEPQNLGDILNLLSDVGFEYYIRLAGETMKRPFIDKTPLKFNQQLNIFCYRK